MLNEFFYKDMPTLNLWMSSTRKSLSENNVCLTIEDTKNNNNQKMGGGKCVKVQYLHSLFCNSLHDLRTSKGQKSALVKIINCQFWQTIICKHVVRGSLKSLKMS